MRGKPLDPVKAMIAQAIQHHVVTGNTRPELPQNPGNVDRTVAYAIGKLDTRIKVYMDDGTVREFSLRLTEVNRGPR